MRAADPPVHYLVGTPKGRLSRYEKELLEQPWQAVREGVQVKLLAQEGELYVLAESKDRVNKERAMRRRQLKGLVQRLKELARMELTRDQLLPQAGAAKNQYPAAWRLVTLGVCRTRRRSPGVRPLSPLRCAETSCARCGGAKGAISCAAISARRPRRSCGSFTFNADPGGSGLRRSQRRRESATDFPLGRAAD